MGHASQSPPWENEFPSMNAAIPERRRSPSKSPVSSSASTFHDKIGFCVRHHPERDTVGSKLKCPLFLARDMSGFIINQQRSGLWESGNPAGFAGFPSGVGKSAL